MATGDKGEKGGVVGGVGVNFYKNRLTNYTITILATRSDEERKVEKVERVGGVT